jgi:hypothetical protein
LTIKGRIKEWALKDIETAIYLHDALLNWRHWSDDIKNGEGTVLIELEEHYAGLARTIRRCLNDISSGLSNFRPIYEDGLSEEIKYERIHFIQSPLSRVPRKPTFDVSAARKPFKTALSTDVECLRLQVDPIRTFTEARKGSGKVALVRAAADSWRKEQERVRIGKSKAVDDQQNQGMFQAKV